MLPAPRPQAAASHAPAEGEAAAAERQQPPAAEGQPQAAAQQQQPAGGVAAARGGGGGSGSGASGGVGRQGWRRRLHTYLDWLFQRDPSAGADFASLQVGGVSFWFFLFLG